MNISRQSLLVMATLMLFSVQTRTADAHHVSDYLEPSTTVPAKLYSVIDGDTIVLYTQGVRLACRLAMIDAPEKKQPLHREAAKALKKKLDGRKILIDVIHLEMDANIAIVIARVGERNVVEMSEKELCAMRGRCMAMVFQDPLSALHPYFTVGRQIAEAYRVHNAGSAAAARRRAVDLLGRVGIPQPSRRVDSYPHELSGGMRQRAMIAMALSCNPELLIADEPTTALDATVQAQILDLMLELQDEFQSTLILITHDLAVVAGTADDVLVMYAGRVAESGPAAQVLQDPQHPYTQGLLRSIPSLTGEPGGGLVPIEGNPPSMIDVPPGCPFHPRCPSARQNGVGCSTIVPRLESTAGDRAHRVACHRAGGDERPTFERRTLSTRVAS